MHQLCQMLRAHVGRSAYCLRPNRDFSSYYVEQVVIDSFNINAHDPKVSVYDSKKEKTELKALNVFFNGEEARRECLRLNRELIQDKIDKLKKQMSELDKSAGDING